MNVDITIPLPVLLPSEYFRVRYRLIGDPTWTNAANQTNAQFTLDLPAGDYEFEFTLYQVSGPCPAVIKTLTVVETSEEEGYCVDATFVIEPSGTGYRLRIDYTVVNASPCGYKVRYSTGGGPFTDQTYSTLPASPLIYTVPNTPHRVQFLAILCDGQEVICYDVDVPPATVTCEPAVLTGVTFVSGGSQTYLRFAVTQSNPFTNPFSVAFAQTDTPTTGLPDQGGPVNISAGPTTTSFLVPINPNYNVPLTNSVLTIHYAGSLVDGCGKSTPWTAQFDLT